jgi:hypothetical protein
MPCQIYMTNPVKIKGELLWDQFPASMIFKDSNDSAICILFTNLNAWEAFADEVHSFDRSLQPSEPTP